MTKQALIFIRFGVSRSLSECRKANEVWGQICDSFFISFFTKENQWSRQGVKTPRAVRVTLRCSNSADSMFPQQLEHRTPIVEVASWDVSVLWSLRKDLTVYSSPAAQPLLWYKNPHTSPWTDRQFWLECI